jgi:Protein of unknown function (DUF2637)
MTTNNHDFGPGLWDIHSGRLHRGEDGAEITTTVYAHPDTEPRPPGSVLIGFAGWLLVILAAGLFLVSFTGQYSYIFAARHQSLPTMIESAMFDAGMIIFALLALGLARARKSARTERALIVACAFGSAAMNYAAADDASPRSVIAYTAAPVFLAIVVDRVIAVIRRHVLGDAEASPWAPLGRFVAGLARVCVIIALYTLRFFLDAANTGRGLRLMVLNAAPVPQARKVRVITPPPEVHFQPPNGTTKKAQLLTLYRQHPDYGDRAKVSQVAGELAPKAGLQPGTARTYLYAEVDGQAS